MSEPAAPLRLRVLSYNIQVAIRTQRFAHNFTRAWRHALPGPGMHGTLDRMAEQMRGYDFVALQEADAGSLRTQFTNQVEYLARAAGFAYWGLTVTRNLRPIARHALAFLSRLPPLDFHEHVLPSPIPGRHALSVHFGGEAGGLQVLVAHLSLGRAAQRQQFAYLDGLVQARGPVLLLGDLNCEAQELRHLAREHASRLCVPEAQLLTFPSWQPRRGLDHLLHSADLQLHTLAVLPLSHSDHLPLAAELLLPCPPTPP